MNYDFEKCKYTAAELKGKTVQVLIPISQTNVYEGEAEFDAIQNQNGLIRLAIIYDCPTTDGSIMAARLNIPSDVFNKIVKNPPGSKCEFSLNAIVRVNSDYTALDLHGKLVDFSLRTNDGHVYAGVGRLIVFDSGTVGIGVLQEGQGPDGYSTVVSPIFPIPAGVLVKLVRNPLGSKNPFSF